MRRYYLAIGLACSAIFLGVYVLLYAGPLVLMRFAMAPTTQLPIMAITGVMALLVSLALVSLTFSLAGLSDRGEALGLPRGSVRAVISLSLIVLFAITSFAFQSSFAGGVQKTEALTEGEAAALRANLHGDELVATLPSGDAQRPTVVVYRTGSRSRRGLRAAGFHHRRHADDGGCELLLRVAGRGGQPRRRAGRTRARRRDRGSRRVAGRGAGERGGRRGR